MDRPTNQTEVFRQMTPAQKLNAAMRLYWSARELKAGAIRAQKPDWTEDRINKAVSEAFLFARS